MITLSYENSSVRFSFPRNRLSSSIHQNDTEKKREHVGTFSTSIVCRCSFVIVCRYFDTGLACDRSRISFSWTLLQSTRETLVITETNPSPRPKKEEKSQSFFNVCKFSAKRKFFFLTFVFSSFANLRTSEKFNKSSNKSFAVKNRK